MNSLVIPMIPYSMLLNQSAFPLSPFVELFYCEYTLRTYLANFILLDIIYNNFVTNILILINFRVNY